MTKDRHDHHAAEIHRGTAPLSEGLGHAPAFPRRHRAWAWRPPCWAAPCRACKPRKAYAALSGTVNFTTWPNYFAQENFDNFTKKTGVKINVSGLRLERGNAGQAAGGLHRLGCLRADQLHDLDLQGPRSHRAARSQAAAQLRCLPRRTRASLGAGTIDGTVYAVPKDWGTTGFVINTKNVTQNPTSWKEFWDLTQGPLTGRVMVHDYQLTTIGNALKYFGYSFNSNDEKQLAEAEKLMLEAKPHLFGINSDYQPSMRNGDAWMSVCWTGDATQLHRDIPEMQYVIGKEGGEIWTDYYAIPKGAPNREAAYALID